MKKLKLTYRELFKKLNMDDEVSKEQAYEKIPEIFVKTPEGELTKINAFVKKPKNKTVQVNFVNGLNVRCSENHIFMNDGAEVFAKNSTDIDTTNGSVKVESIAYIEDEEHYDISIDAPHLYVSPSGVIHHNSKMSTSILKYAAEHDDILPYDKMEDVYDDHQYVAVASVKSNAVLADDLFWKELEQKEFDFVILDDLDFFLTSRNNEVTSNDEDQKNKFLNQFLSFTDGLEKSKTKFIITTNQPYKDLDTAVLRKGRLFDILELRDLSNEEALVIWKENDLKKKDFPYKGRVLPADLGSEIAKRKNTKIQESTEPYILEEGISKIDIQNKKAGF